MSNEQGNLQVLLTGEFSSPGASCTQYLCLEIIEDEVRLSVRGYEVLAELSEFEVEGEDGEADYDLPETIDGKPVGGTDGEYVIGAELVMDDFDDEIVLSTGAVDEAMNWLKEREWNRQQGFAKAWEIIRRAIQA